MPYITHMALPMVVWGLADNQGFNENEALLEVPTLDAEEDLTTPDELDKFGSSDAAPPISPPQAERGPLLPCNGL